MYITILVILVSTKYKSTQCLEQASNMPRDVNKQIDMRYDNTVDLSTNLLTPSKAEVVDPELQFDSAQVRWNKAFQVVLISKYINTRRYKLP